MPAVLMPALAEPVFRHHLLPHDPVAIARLHQEVYCDEYGLGPRFVEEVLTGVERTARLGWPEAGGVWLVEVDGQVRGSLALTFEGRADDGFYAGQVRWFVLGPELRHRGLGRRLFGELIDTAVDQGIDRLWLHTFSDLGNARRIYEDHHFVLVAERRRRDWKQDGSPVTYQTYVRHLRPGLD